MVKRHALAFLLAMSGLSASTTKAEDAAVTTVIAGQEVALVGAAGDLVFPSGIYGTRGDAIEQVDEITAKIEAMLEAHDLNVADLMRHTIFLKAGAQEPARTFTRLIGNLRRLAPELNNSVTAGTIVLVPSFPDPATEIMVEFVGGRAPGGMTRVPIMFGPRMSVESVGNEQFVASFGIEGLDFYGVGGMPNGTLDEELDSLVRILSAMLGHAGLTIANVVSYKLYVTQGTDPVEATAKLHQLMRQKAPGLSEYPSTGAVVVLNGATLPSLKVQLTVIASRSKPATLSRVLPGEESAGAVAQSVSAGGAVFVSGINGVGREKNGDAAAQAEAAARNVSAALRKAGGLKLSNVARFDVYIKHGEDAAAALAAFYKAARKLDASFDPKKVAAVVAMVQGFTGDSTRFLVSAVAASKQQAASGAAPPHGPWIGTWRRKADTPTGAANGAPVFSMKVEGDGFRYTFVAPPATHMEGFARFDGKQYPEKGNPMADFNVFTRIDDRTYAIADIKDGKETIRFKVTISPDGKTRTSVATRRNAAGEEVTSVGVWERVE